MEKLIKQSTKRLIDRAISEDLDLGDITSDILILDKEISCATIVVKQSCVLAGQSIAKLVFTRLDPQVIYETQVSDGSEVKSGACISRIKGSTRSILAGERIALNFLQRMSGIATITKIAVSKIQSTSCVVVDTRKTIPGWRLLDKFAVKMGGGQNHRICLGDGILIKDNHIQAVGGVRKAVELAKRHRRHLLKIQIEVTNSQEAIEAVNAGAEVLLLDNMKPPQLRKTVEKVLALRRDVTMEASGNINLDNLLEYAQTGVHLISMGYLTHSVPAADLSLYLE